MSTARCEISTLVSVRPQMHFLTPIGHGIRRIAEFNETKPQPRNEDGDVVSSSNIGKHSHPHVVVCSRKFYWILLSRKLQNLQDRRSTGKESPNLKNYTFGRGFNYYGIIPTTKINTLHSRRDTLYKYIVSYCICWISGFKIWPGDRPVLSKYIPCYSTWRPNTLF